MLNKLANGGKDNKFKSAKLQITELFYHPNKLETVEIIKKISCKDRTHDGDDEAGCDIVFVDNKWIINNFKQKMGIGTIIYRRND